MSSFEAIMRERGLSYGDYETRADSNGCSYNPSEGGHPDGDCGQIARWHLKLRSEDVDTGVTIAACDSHLGVAHCVYGGVLLDYHEWGSACNLQGAWWIEPEGDGSFCATVERGIELGYLQYAEAPTERVSPD